MRIPIIFGVIVLLFVSISCSEDWLELTPRNEKTEATFFLNEDDAIAAVTAAYVPGKMAGLYGNDIQYLYYTFDNYITFENATWETFSFQANTTSRITNLYYDLCRGVFRCNYAIINIRTMDNLDEDLKKRLIAECQFLRAFYYFWQTKSFNEPPLVRDEVFKEYGIIRGNNTREEFYAAIIEDLEEAIEVLPLSYPSQQVGRATKGAALALLGKAYLYKASYAPANNVSEDYANARDYLKQVIDLGVYDLSMPKGTDSSDYVNAYLCNFAYRDLTDGVNPYKSENNIESIWEIQYNQDPNMEDNRPWWPGVTNNGSLLFMYFGPVDSWLNIAPRREFMLQFESVENHPGGLRFDPRRAATFWFPGDYVGFSPLTGEVYFDPKVNTKSHIGEGIGLRKYYYPLHEDNGSRWPFNYPNNWRAIRFADVLLMYAEACYQLGETGNALIALNRVRNRVGMPEYQSEAEITPAAIMHEREVELGAECIHFFDLVRWNLMENPWVPDIENVIPYYTVGRTEFLPIPLNEILAMEGLLEQNPGY